MSINLKKSSCLRVGPRCDATCAVITSSTGRSLPLVGCVAQWLELQSLTGELSLVSTRSVADV